jgi:hypothetical protein
MILSNFFPEGENKIFANPLIGLIVPSKPNSPKKRVLLQSSGISISLQIFNIATAMERSNQLESFFNPDGERLTRIFFIGKKKPEFSIAIRTLSVASFTFIAAKPTIVNLGIPFLIFTSTFIIFDSKPFCLRIYAPIHAHALESNPPLKKTPIGASAKRCRFTDFTKEILISSIASFLSLIISV